MSRPTCTILLVLSTSICFAQTPDVSTQIAQAVLAAPADMRDNATVMGYDGSDHLVILREGSNVLICTADKPGDERFQVVCYHESLEPFIDRGRELSKEGVEGDDSYEIRHKEMDLGTLPMPETGAALYNLGMPMDRFDPDSAKTGLYVIYTPYATSESTGLPTSPPGPGVPWIMRTGTPSSHVMIVAK